MGILTGANYLTVANKPIIRTVSGRTLFGFVYDNGTAFFIREEKTALFFHKNYHVSRQSLEVVLSKLPKKSYNQLVPTGDTPIYLLPNIDIMLTDKCNLKCCYCYSDAAPHKKTIGFERVQKAIDFVFRNSKILRRITGTPQPVSVGFTGGGEPTFDAELLIKSLKYLNEKSAISGVPFSCYLQTNGQADLSCIELASKLGCSHMVLSMDGIARVQDSQRGRRDATSSFQNCLQFLEAANKYGIGLTVRTTLTKASLEGLNEFVIMLDSSYPMINKIYVDTISLAGRGESMLCERPGVDEICDGIVRARSLKLNNVIVSHFCMNLSRFSFYCGLADQMSSIIVSPSNYISLCPEHVDPAAGDKSEFVVGYYEDNAPIITSGARSRWEKVKEYEQCKNCIALYTCAGGCRSKIRISESGIIEDEESLYWCEMIKSLTAIELYDCFFELRLYPLAKRHRMEGVAGAPEGVSVVEFG